MDACPVAWRPLAVHGEANRSRKLAFVVVLGCCKRRREREGSLRDRLQSRQTGNVIHDRDDGRRSLAWLRSATAVRAALLE
jgi:hypothetical protein